MLKNYTILYVEDEPGVQRNIQEYLEGYFKEVYVASDGREGLKKYNTCNPDVLLLDIDLPHMDGLSLAKTIRKSDRNISIVMLTAFTDQEKLLQATELKLLKYLIKPVELISFQNMLDLLAQELSLISTDSICLGDGYVWNNKKQEISLNGEELLLTSKEQELLALLVKNKNTSVSFEDIMVKVWEDEFEREISINCVKNVVSNLRKNLPEGYIKSVYGKGYMISQ